MSKLGTFVKLCLLVALALLLIVREESLFALMKPIMQAKEKEGLEQPVHSLDAWLDAVLERSRYPYDRT
jgi:hypothetical protein